MSVTDSVAYCGVGVAVKQQLKVTTSFASKFPASEDRCVRAECGCLGHRLCSRLSLLPARTSLFPNYYSPAFLRSSSECV
ncbi:unnamed protein product [Toxocara canis]|nr:unnamed protein product [Toxocara canis]